MRDLTQFMEFYILSKLWIRNWRKRTLVRRVYLFIESRSSKLLQVNMLVVHYQVSVNMMLLQSEKVTDNAMKKRSKEKRKLCFRLLYPPYIRITIG